MATQEERFEAMDRIYKRIDRTRMAWRATRGLDGLARVLLVVSIGLLLGILAAGLSLPGWAWLTWAVALAACVLYEIVRRLLLPLLEPVTDEMVARHLENASPDLDNRMINAVLLADEEFDDALAERMVAVQLEQTAEGIKRKDMVRAHELRRLRRILPAACVAVALLVGVCLLLPGNTRMALQRLTKPYPKPELAPQAELNVVPGDVECLQGSTLRVQAHVADLQSARIVRISGDGAETEHEMPFQGSAFAYDFPNVQEDFSYRVEAGESLSQVFKVTVLRRPSVQELAVAYTYPDYTGLPTRVEQGTAGDILAPPGSHVDMTVTTDRPVLKGSIELTLNPEQSGAEPVKTVSEMEVLEGGTKLRTSIDVNTGGTYRLSVMDGSGFSNIPIPRRIEATDRVPRVTVSDPDRDVTLGVDGKLSLQAVAEDDFNIRVIELVVRREDGEGLSSKPELSYERGAQVQRIVNGTAELDAQSLGLAAGDTLLYQVRAGDGREGLWGLSRTYRMRVASPDAVVDAAPQTQEDLRSVVRRLIKMQEENLSHTGELLAWAAGQEALGTGEANAWTDYRGRGKALVAAEDRIIATADMAGRSEPVETRSTLATALVRLASGPMAEAAERLRDVESTQDAPNVPVRGTAAQDQQRVVVVLLKGLLDNPAAVLANLLKDEDNTEELAEQMDDLYDARQMAEKMREQMEKFREEQKEIVELSNQLAQKEVDDFTEEDEKLANQIAETERKWARIFQEMATDLSKLQPQDHSLSGQLKELQEVYSEVIQAAEEAERKAIEMAVPHEQAGAELAESIETNIEKWLMEDKDDQAWKMEDPTGDYETPIAELPEELQDLIGELVEDEEDMQEQFDDATSGWLDSMDKGAGWDTTDGPISNMSAKGVTGNRLPNTSEIGGRSGEGRTGKATGQFVEEEATGKGGRQTPTRMTPDPFEGGSVKDSSQEAGTGATGGGKDSGEGQEGFQGPVPPPVQDKLKRMVSVQQEMIEKARRIDYGLKKYGHPRGNLPETIEMMEQMKEGLAKGEISTFTKFQRVVLSDLRDVKEASEKVKATRRDRSAPLPKELRDEIASAEREPMPEQYEALIRSYFRALAEEGTE